MKPLEYKTQHHPTTSNTLYRTPYLNNKQNKNTNKIISRQDYHPSVLPIRGKSNKQTNKLSTNLTLYEPYTNPWANFRRAETKRKKEFNLEAWEKETSKTVSKTIIIIMKRQRNTTQMKQQTRNTEVQINEEKIGKLPEKKKSE